MPYYLFDGEKPIGPFEAVDLARRPGFDKDTLVFPLGALDPNGWKPAREFPDLALAFEPAPTTGEEKQLAAPSDKLILLVDDDEMLRSFMSETLSAMGFRVIAAANGLEAGAKLESHAPDLIITDLMMPGQGGYEFVRALQATASARIPVFVVTGSRINDATIMMIRAEGNVIEFFPKPLPMGKFISAIHRTLNTPPPPRRLNPGEIF